MQNLEPKNVGRAPERSETVAGNEVTGQPAIRTQQAIQPEPVEAENRLRLPRRRAKLSLTLSRALKPANNVDPKQRWHRREA
jgi:hypothetical protein